VILRRLSAVALAAVLTLPAAHAQQSLGSISGKVTDATGAAIPGATIALVSDQTAATRSAVSTDNGTYGVRDLSIGTYTITVSAPGFNTEKLTGFRVQADRTAALTVHLKPGAVSSTIDVAATPQLDVTDITNGYVLDSAQIEKTPLGTGSFTQLATLSPGVHADLLADTGTNTGLGNQNIYSNGQRLSSNTFTMNSVMSNNLFNGASSSQVAESRAVLNTGESFQTNGTIRTNTSIFDAIGQALPSPPQQTIAEERVNTSMFDASQGATAGAHIDVTTKSGTNQFHGSAYGNVESSKFNANPFFNKQIGLPTPDLHRYVAGAELGGPVLKDKLFFYASYQYTRARDQLNSSTSYFAPTGLTDDRSPTGLQSVVLGAGLPAGTPIDPVALAFFQAKLPNGQYLIRSPAVQDAPVVFFGSASKFQADQANGNATWIVSKKDTLSSKYYFQHDPTESPFSSTPLEGFPQKFNAGSQVFALENTIILSPRLSWEQKLGILRMTVASLTGQPFGPSDVGINLFGSTALPGVAINTVDSAGNGLNIGPTSNFSNTGFAQNTIEGTSTLILVAGKHSFSFGGNYDFTQLNILNRANQVASLAYASAADFLTGGPLFTTGGNTVFFQGASNRYYRSPQVGAYAQDQWKVTPNLTVTAGIRYDYDGGLFEKNGNLVNFDPARYSYNLASDAIVNSGLIVAGNNKQYATPGASKSTLTNRQWGIGPRLGVAYSVTPKLVARAGFGIYYDRGEFFTNFSPSAGGGFNGPFGVTLQPPFVQPVFGTSTSTSENPFGTKLAPIDTNPADFINNLPNQAALESGSSPYLFGAYAANNKLPYTENWSLDLQYQVLAKTVVSLGYTGTHGLHQSVPLPFNQPLVATPQSPVNGQIYSYGFNATDANGNTLLSEPFNTSTGGNTDLRAPYIGYSPNSVEWSTVGWSHYNALLFSAHTTSWHGLDTQLSYTWSHSLDTSSGFGLFYNGNDPRNLRSGYASSDYDRTHVTSLSFNYQIPDYTAGNLLARKAGSGWGLSAVNIFQSGQPYNVYDFSAPSAASSSPPTTTSPTPSSHWPPASPPNRPSPATAEPSSTPTTPTATPTTTTPPSTPPPSPTHPSPPASPAFHPAASPPAAPPPATTPNPASPPAAETSSAAASRSEPISRSIKRQPSANATASASPSKSSTSPTPPASTPPAATSPAATSATPQPSKPLAPAPTPAPSPARE